MPEHHPRQGLDLDVAHRVALRLGELHHLRLREPDVLELALGERRHQRRDLLRAQPEAFGRVAVEALAHLAHRRVAALRNVGERGLHRLADAGVVARALGVAAPALEMLHRHGVSSVFGAGRGGVRSPRS